MQQLQHQVSVPVSLEVGTHMVSLRRVCVSSGGVDRASEPLVMLWIYGGNVVNQKTGVPVAATWSTLNGYDDILTLEVLEPTTLYAFCLGSDTIDQTTNSELQLTIVRI
ncbi:hypothetical protein HJG54_13380 [Leptolyngbya sp. NK1-12]|uniref:Uncharacterized protein n=1 Tax=Leptolyngbya sp. NK1-12 TaxID=2547451 RepID=A0AA97AFZ8_9CYAN|nr:hypothetical protein [Leptolyngbya sp. NK1-12]WNZ23745.1 hypothetical protein HJG54_13380 [Leptolyngbya sp. NK1-12]